MDPRKLHLRWLSAYALAELIGIGAAATLYAALRAALGAPFTGGERALVLTGMAAAGAIEGAALGGFGWYVLRDRFPRVRKGEWIAVTVVAAVVGWVAGMMGPVLSEGAETSGGPGLLATFGLGALVGLFSGAIFGAMQWLVLRHHAQKAERWIAANAVGWAPAMGVIFVAASLPEPAWSVAAIGATGAFGGLLGGALLGAVTGWMLARLQPWVDESKSLRGKVALITGANSGIGFEVARSLASREATVVMLCRNEDAAAHALAKILASSPEADVHLVHCDLMSLNSVLHAAMSFRDRWDRLDMLVNNAGASFPTYTVTEDGLEATLAVDVMGPFLLTSLLRDRLEHAQGRVVNLTGIYQRNGRVDLHDLRFEHRPYDWREANAQAQLARLLLTAELGRRSKNMIAVAVHPGAVLTNAQRSAPAWARALIHTVLRPGFVRPEVGALPVVRLATEPLEGDISGRFFSRYSLEPDAPDRHLAEAFWRACEEATLRFLFQHEGPGMEADEDSSRLA